MKKAHYFKYYLPGLIAATILAGTIVSLDLAHWTATTFIVCYAIFLVLAGLAIAVFTIRKFFLISTSEQVKRLKSWAVYSALFFLVNWLIFRDSFNVYDLTIPLATAFGISFFDLLFASES